MFDEHIESDIIRYESPNARQYGKLPKKKRIKLMEERELPFSNPGEEITQQNIEPAVMSLGYNEYYGNKSIKKPLDLDLQWGAKALSQKGTIKFTDYRKG
jgi:hypothetical protein